MEAFLGMNKYSCTKGTAKGPQLLARLFDDPILGFFVPSPRHPQGMC